MWEKIKKRTGNLVFFRSLRVRIFFLLMIMGLIPGHITRSMLINNYEKRAVSVKMSEVSNQFKIISNHLITYHYLSDTSSEVINAELNQIDVVIHQTFFNTL